jgi:hypothetical protein
MTLDEMRLRMSQDEYLRWIEFYRYEAWQERTAAQLAEVRRRGR